MIVQLTGKLIDNSGQYSTIDVQGVGYGVYTTDNWQAKQLIDTQVTLFIYTHVKEDALELYGFASKQDKYIFELLLSVSGIGPRTALAILNQGAKSIETAISTADVDFFTRIPRIGKKNAQKIIIELKQKIGSITDLNLQDDTGMEKDIIDALTGMGFQRYDIQQVLKLHFDKESSLEINMKKVLKLLSKNNV